MRCPTLSELPPPPPSKTGWPWTEESEQLPDTMPSGEPWPRVSIVTPSYSQGQFIEETIRSVLLQGYPNLEYIIIDGGSEDGSVEIIRKYEHWLAYWVSEPDRGQVHAINKGLVRTTGDIFNWINSDDLLSPGALAVVATNIGDGDMVAGACVHFTEEGIKKTVTCAGLTSRRLIWGAKFSQPAIWVRPECIPDCGGIDEDFHYAFDWDLFIRYLSLFPRAVYTRSSLACFRLHENSKTFSVKGLWRPEGIAILNKLARSEKFRSLHRTCNRRLRNVAWREMLQQVALDKSMSRWRRIVSIIGSSFQDPGIRWSRWTFVVIRHICFQDDKVV